MRFWADILVKPPCLRDGAGRTQSLNYTPAFALKLRKNHGKPSVRVAKKFRAKERWHDSLCRLGDLDWPAELSHSLLALQVTLVKPRSV